MTVEEVIQEYKSAKKISAKHNVLKYMPHTKKIAFAKGIVDATSYVEANGKKIYKRDTPTMMFLFSMRLVKEYTDIEIHDDKVTEEYDLLVSSGAMNAILSIISSEEIEILKGTLDFIRDDLEENTRSLVSFLETKFESVDIAMNTIMNILDKPEIKEKLASLKG